MLRLLLARTMAREVPELWVPVPVPGPLLVVWLVWAEEAWWELAVPVGPTLALMYRESSNSDWVPVPVPVERSTRDSLLIVGRRDVDPRRWDWGKCVCVGGGGGPGEC